MTSGEKLELTSLLVLKVWTTNTFPALNTKYLYFAKLKQNFKILNCDTHDCYILQRIITKNKEKYTHKGGGGGTLMKRFILQKQKTFQLFFLSS